MDKRVVKRNVILAVTLWLKQQPSNVLLLELYLKLEEIVHVKRKIVIYVAYCLNCQKQCVGSTVCWKARLKNYKSNI